MPVTMADERDDELSGSPDEDREIHYAKRTTETQRENTYVSCWRLANSESDALWRLYATKHDGIAIRASYKSLVNALHTNSNLYVGIVKYIDYANERYPRDSAMYNAMHKRTAFAYESEVRLVQFERAELRTGEPPRNREVAVDVETLIERVVVGPYCHDFYFEAVRDVLEKFRPALTDRLEWSAMKVSPRY